MSMGIAIYEILFVKYFRKDSSLLINSEVKIYAQSQPKRKSSNLDETRNPFDAIAPKISQTEINF